MYSNILATLTDGIYLITINRPAKMNALNEQVIAELSDAVDNVYKNASVKAAIITGAGEKAFVAGADISEFSSLDGKGGKLLAKRGQEMVFNKIENCPKPIVAAVNGFALGGGCELAMACHFRMASTQAKFGQPEVNLGLIPGYGGTQRLTQLVGKGRAMEYLMTGSLITAETALNIGLVNHIFQPTELLPETIKLLNLIISKAPLAVTEIIKLTNVASTGNAMGYDMEIEAFGNLFDTDDVKEGVKAFLEKRKPDFKGQ